MDARSGMTINPKDFIPDEGIEINPAEFVPDNPAHKSIIDKIGGAISRNITQPLQNYSEYAVRQQANDPYAAMSPEQIDQLVKNNPAQFDVMENNRIKLEQMAKDNPGLEMVQPLAKDFIGEKHM